MSLFYVEFVTRGIRKVALAGYNGRAVDGVYYMKCDRLKLYKVNPSIPNPKVKYLNAYKAVIVYNVLKRIKGVTLVKIIEVTKRS
jgi:hypothetical protein